MVFRDEVPALDSQSGLERVEFLGAFARPPHPPQALAQFDVRHWATALPALLHDDSVAFCPQAVLDAAVLL